ncbi:MAG: tripartite tricarboxylate transporter TctB family protein [Hyphomicrobiales bacterium]|nr:tripartite tricarboxylate transporter TctB family protein [Hyphomicrobiales bacterium]
MLRVKSPQNLAAGVLFLAIGLGGFWYSRDLSYGSSHNMGPGFFPTWLSVLIALLGLIAMARSTVLVGPPIERLQWRPIVLVSVAALLFGYFIQYIGLALSLVMMTMVAVQSRRDTNQREMLVLAVGMAVVSVIVFVYILKQGMPAWWGR